MDEEADLRVSPGKARRSARRTHSSKPQQTVARADSAPTPLASEANSIAGSEVLLVLAIPAAVQAWTPPFKICKSGPVTTRFAMPPELGLLTVSQCLGNVRLRRGD